MINRALSIKIRAFYFANVASVILFAVNVFKAISVFVSPGHLKNKKSFSPFQCVI